MVDAALFPALETLLAVARTGSVGAAARQRHITSSAVSQQIRRLETHFGRWQPGEAGEMARAPAPDVQRPARQLLLADLPDAPQSRILVGGVSATSATADYFPIQVLNAVLRRRFGSARTPTIRGDTTGVRAAFDRRRSGGPLALATAAQVDKTAEALAEILAELAGVRSAIAAES